MKSTIWIGSEHVRTLNQAGQRTNFLLRSGKRLMTRNGIVVEMVTQNSKPIGVGFVFRRYTGEFTATGEELAALTASTREAFMQLGLGTDDIKMSIGLTDHVLPESLPEAV